MLEGELGLELGALGDFAGLEAVRDLADGGVNAALHHSIEVGVIGAVRSKPKFHLNYYIINHGPTQLHFAISSPALSLSLLIFKLYDPVWMIIIPSFN